VLGRNESSGPGGQGVYGYAASGGVGVLAVSEGNDGLSARTNAAGKSAVFGFTEVATSYAGYFFNAAPGGVALRSEGLAQVKTLQILGGADLAERFESREDAEPGTVMAIDPEAAGGMCISGEAYSRRVAGVVSGAKDLKAGVVLSEDGETHGTVAIALTGRVWVKCDAAGGAIRPGDLLTSASRPGHAMLASDPARSTGAILGKAMTSLEHGTGLVLVLVSLQ
jgi:hypothetical protein